MSIWTGTYDIKEQDRIVEVWMSCSIFDDLWTNYLTSDLNLDARRHDVRQLELPHAPDAPAHHLQHDIISHFKHRPRHSRPIHIDDATRLDSCRRVGVGGVNGIRDDSRLLPTGWLIMHDLNENDGRNCMTWKCRIPSVHATQNNNKHYCVVAVYSIPVTTSLSCTAKHAATLRGSRPGVQSASLIMTSLMTS